MFGFAVRALMCTSAISKTGGVSTDRANPAIDKKAARLIPENTRTIIRPPCPGSIVSRLFLDVIDDENGIGTLLRFQFQPELFLDRVEYCGSADWVRGCNRSFGRQCGRRRAAHPRELVRRYRGKGKSKVPGSNNAGCIEYRITNIRSRDHLQLICELSHRDVLTGDQESRHREGTEVRHDRSISQLASRATRGIRFLEFRFYRYQRIGGHRPVFEMRLHFEAVLQQGLQHRPEILKRCRRAVGWSDGGRRLRDDVESGRIEPFRRPNDLPEEIEVPCELDRDSQRETRQIDTAPGEKSESSAFWWTRSRHGGLDIRYFELGRG